MRWKSVFAVLLAVFFLSASSWATVCDLACTGAAQRHLCPTCRPSSHTTAEHEHCAHMAGQKSSLTAHIELTASSQCAHAFCSLTANANLPTKTLQPDQLQWTAGHAASPMESGILPVRYIDKAPPPIPVDSGRSLTVALRI